MTKDQLIRNVANQIGSSVTETKTYVEATFEQLSKCFTNKEGLEIRGFGSFRIVKRKSKMARDISRNRTIIVPEKLAVKFKLSNDIAKKL